MNAPLAALLSERQRNILLVLMLTVISFCTWVYHYQSPSNLFWDENYHIASAQKYLNGVFFQEPHPPLGKLLIAFGEKLLNRNANDTTFVDSDHGKSIPENFSFEGYRFFPVLLAWLTVPLFFLLLLAISRNSGGSFFVALLYAFDNAMIVHMRGAMLEGIQMFFIVGALLALAFVHGRNRPAPIFLSGLLLASALYSAAVATKVTALVLGLAFVPLFLPLLREPRRFLRYAGLSLVAFLLVQYVVWQTHFTLTRRVIPANNNKGFYQASDEYKAIIATRTQANPLNFWVMFRDSVHFFKHYEKGVPILNMCKTGETGSFPLFWPVGARSISYRWDSSNGKTAHIYLQINPVVWFVALTGIIFAVVMILNAVFFSTNRRFQWGADIPREWIYTYTAMWVSYMVIMLSVGRVMYLYHYFIPLMFSLVLLQLMLPRLVLVPKLESRTWFRPLLAMLLTVSSISSFYFFAPLTYAWPISDEEMGKRSWLSIWDLHCPSCSLTNEIARPWVDQKDKQIPRLYIGKVVSRDGMQEWGEPVQDATVERKPLVVNGITYTSGLGVHARSEIRFPIDKKYFSFSGKVGLPDYLKDKAGNSASVVFEILLDGARVWQSRKITPFDQVQSFDVPVVQAEVLELRVLDAGDGNENDHALWLDPQLK